MDRSQTWLQSEPFSSVQDKGTDLLLKLITGVRKNLETLEGRLQERVEKEANKDDTEEPQATAA